MEKQIHLADNQFEELKVLLNELKNQIRRFVRARTKQL